MVVRGGGGGLLPHLQVRGQGCCLAVECLLSIQKALGVESLAHMHRCTAPPLSLSLSHAHSDRYRDRDREGEMERGRVEGSRWGLLAFRGRHISWERHSVRRLP